jgi:hypothetical protein
MTIDVLRLSDSKLSVRVDDDEVYLLPAKKDTEVHDLEKAFRSVAKHIEQEAEKQEPEIQEW